MKNGIRKWVPAALLAGLLAGAGQAAEISNGTLRVVGDPAGTNLSLSAGGSAVFSDLRFADATGGRCQAARIELGNLGSVPALRWERPDGAVDEVMAPQGTPFVLFRRTLTNSSPALVVNRQVPLLSGLADWGTAAKNLRVLGTGGLTTPDGATARSGSYMWMAVAEPGTRRGLVAGWVTMERGSGVVLSSVTNGRVELSAQLDYGRLALPSGKSETSEVFALGWFEDARLGMEAWADLVAKVNGIKLPPQPVGYCTWYHSGASNEKELAQLTTFAAGALKPYGFSVVQIDDGWQDGINTNGPRKDFTKVRAGGPYPGGMKATADFIRQAGLVPGLWFMPFAGTWNDPWFADKQHFFVKGPDGRPFVTPWGGTSLDMTQPAAREYVRDLVRRIAQDWGYTYFKMDGLYTGLGTRQVYVNDAYRDDHFGETTLFDPEKTHVEAFRSGLRLIRDTAGRAVYILGCCVPQNMRSYGGSFGLVDAMRIGPDNGANWNGLKTGPDYGTRNYHLHGRIWWNDPDPLYVRTSLPLNEARLICSWVALSGQINMSSDALPQLPPERLDLLRRTMPSHGLQARPVDLFESRLPSLWLLKDERHQPVRQVLGLFNWEDAPRQFEVPLERLGLKPATDVVAFDYWENAFVPTCHERLTLSVPAHSCRILSLQPVATHPQLLGTSRHITQGVTDVLEEKWDEAAGTLSGRSLVVGGDPYELRLVALGNQPGQGWSLETATLSTGDQSAGVTVTSRAARGLFRVQIDSTTNREVSWSLRFKRARVTEAKPDRVSNLKAEAQWFGGAKLTWNSALADGITFEIRRGDALPAITAAREWTDSKVEAGQTYEYTVVALDWLGQRSELVLTTLTVPRPPDLGPAPPKPEVSLSTLKAQRATAGWGRVGINQSCSGGPLILGDRTYTNGIGTHAASELIYAREPEWKRFVAVAGIDGSQRQDERSSIVFKVIAQDRKKNETVLALSPLLKHGPLDHWHFDVRLPASCAKLRLVVEDGGDENKADHADWCEAGFLR